MNTRKWFTFEKVPLSRALAELRLPDLGKAFQQLQETLSVFFEKNLDKIYSFFPTKTRFTYLETWLQQFYTEVDELVNYDGWVPKGTILSSFKLTAGDHVVAHGCDWTPDHIEFWEVRADAGVAENVTVCQYALIDATNLYLRASHDCWVTVFLVKEYPGILGMTYDPPE